MKKWTISVVAIVFAVLLVLPACATPTQTPKPAEHITLKFAHTMPPGASLSKGWHWWAEEVGKQTDGRVEVEMYPSATLVGIPASIDSVISAVADISITSTGALSKYFPVSSVAGLPGLGFPDTFEGGLASDKAFMELYDKFPEVQAEFKEFKLLWFHQLYNYNLISKNKDIHVPSDIKGLRVGGSGERGDLVESLGGAIVPMVPPDSYMNLDKGTVDAVFLVLGQVSIYKIPEVAKHYLDYGFGSGALPIIMNWDSWNKISANDQKIMMNLVPEMMRIAWEQGYKDQETAMQLIKDSGQEITIPTKDEIALWEKATEPIWEGWVDARESAGVKNAQQILDKWKKLVAEGRK